MEIIPNSSDSGSRTPLVMVTGLDADAVDRAATALLVAGTALVHHDTEGAADGVIMRTVRTLDAAGAEQVHVEPIVLEHGCASCLLRNDLLPLLRRLHRRTSVNRVVLQLNSWMEPEPLAWAIDNAVVAGMPGFVDGPAGLDVTIAATIACVSEMDWLECATGDETMVETGRAADFGPGVDDERTLAQVAVGQVAFADALVVAGCDVAVRDTWESARMAAVLKRLAPGAPIVMEIPQRPVTPRLMASLLSGIGPGARRGRIDGAHGPLLRGQPPLESDCGVQLFEFHADRPFHPGRLHDALDHLLDGVVQTRGRIWLATRPDAALWLESAGGGLRVAAGAEWLAAMDDDALADVEPERRAMAALRWDDRFGDRHTSIVVLAHRADPEPIRAALRAACLTDAELAVGQSFWLAYDDPFGFAHTDPCGDTETPGPIPAESMPGEFAPGDHIERN